MRKVIKGKLYDTERATLIHEYQKYANVNSPYGHTKTWVNAKLYKTQKGNWFEFVEGKNTSDVLNKLDEDNVKEILSNDPEKYEKFFELEDA
ncbi:hypothetical protein SAMN05192559_10830 [Halobacillus karajensis]|uniref:Uncharacterized protein n=1 Tax=Halobacillus karajensis TaxID=195088 RepID=A0A024P4M9_9BACI|nr:hypothetical protein [Halobacillus karajensis]CDQ20832.1 hypothetical protein BN982_03187 [Halobacillus karajensis]CDQ23698.1 hypothetical protein BN983_01949 [Halobacillus karajensis]CDQ27176.1 hypothetical protein BN981_01430 [Halobacillus karajensis]SEI03891.1 hypothetical protein SAMN05192559_10830 [Halobacillus karajensis]